MKVGKGIVHFLLGYLAAVAVIQYVSVTVT